MYQDHNSLVNEQFRKQRKNILYISRCAVKSLIDASCDRPINEESEEVCNFLAVLEHVFSHRLKATAWMSSSEPRRFWEFVKSACKCVPHNSISNIEQMDCPKSTQGKGRAWLQLSLMEKRLAEYMNEMLMQTRMLRQFYQPGALMLSEDAGLVSGLLIGLNVLDFSFDVRSQNLDFIGIPVLDFTPYLKFEQHDLHGMMMMNTEYREIGSEDLNAEFWKTRCGKMDEKYRMLHEQKGYVEELVRLRENQVEESTLEKAEIMERLQQSETEWKKEKSELQSIIIELQGQMCHIEAENWSLQHRLQVLSKRHGMNDLSAIAMSHLMNLEHHEETVVAEEHRQRELDQQADRHSMLSANSLLAERAPPKDDNCSTLALAGSYSSLTTGKEKSPTADAPDVEPPSSE